MIKFSLMNKILLVDDEETIRELFREYLKEDGFLVQTVSSAGDAVEAATKENFDLFLIDLVMSEKDGIELIRELRELNINVPAILLTASETEFGESKKGGLNIIGVISKGMPMADVSKKITELLKGGECGERGKDTCS